MASRRFASSAISAESGRRSGGLLLLTALIAPIQANLIFNGLQAQPASIAIPVLQLLAPDTVLFGWLMPGERPSLLRVAGMCLALVGVVIVAGAPEIAPS
jgi:drug/metabolite transporter (DMT)-like permease